MTSTDPAVFAPWRSILFVPAHIRRYVEKAVTSGADAIQLDLEDSVPVESKSVARAALPEAVSRVRDSEARSDVIVRINRPLTLAIPDIQAAVACGVDAISVTKVCGPEHIRLLEEVILEEEGRRQTFVQPTRLIAIVETAAAMASIDAVAKASSRVVGIMVGGEDLAQECEAAADEEFLKYPKQQMILAAAAAGIVPLGCLGSIADFRDLDAYREMVKRSRRFGFQGSSCIHPSQVSILNDEFGVSDEEIAQAMRLTHAYSAAAAEGRGALELDGRMVDFPMVVRAQRLLDRAALVQSRQKQ